MPFGEGSEGTSSVEQHNTQWVIDRYRAIDDFDSGIAELRTLFEEVTDTQHHNAAAIQAGEIAEVRPYPLETLYPEPHFYTPELTRRATWIDRTGQDHPFLEAEKATGVTAITAGDMHAAAEWGMFPVVQYTDKQQRAAQRPGHSLRTRATELDAVMAQATLRRLYDLKHWRLNETWEYLNVFTSTEREDIQRILGDRNVPDLMDGVSAIHSPTVSNGVLGEKFAFTLLARLGPRMNPACEVFKTRAGVDRIEKLDLLVRYQDDAESLQGIDVSVGSSNEQMWAKFLSTQRKDLPTHTKDPVTWQRRKVDRTSLSWPKVEWPTVMEEWRRKRGSSTITPEFFVRPDRLHTYALRSMNVVYRGSTPWKEYRKNGAADIMQRVYGSVLADVNGGQE